MAENFAERLAQPNLASKTYITNFVNKTDFDDKFKNLNKKVTSNQTKHLLVGNELKNISFKFFIRQSYSNNDGAELFLILLRTIIRTIVLFSSLLDTILEWKSKGLSNEKIEPPFTVNKSLPQNWHG